MQRHDGGDDFFGVFGPCEGLWGLVMLCQVAVDGGLEVDNAAEYAALEPTLGEHGEEALDGIEPGGGCRRAVEDEARVTYQPFDGLWVLVSSVVVENHMDD